MAYGKGPFESVAYYLRLPASSASRLGHDPNEWFPVTYQMLNVQMASHLYLLLREINFGLGLLIGRKIGASQGQRLKGKSVV